MTGITIEIGIEREGEAVTETGRGTGTGTETGIVLGKKRSMEEKEREGSERGETERGIEKGGDEEATQGAGAEIGGIGRDMHGVAQVQVPEDMRMKSPRRRRRRRKRRTMGLITLILRLLKPTS